MRMTSTSLLPSQTPCKKHYHDVWYDDHDARDDVDDEDDDEDALNISFAQSQKEIVIMNMILIIMMLIIMMMLVIMMIMIMTMLKTRKKALLEVQMANPKVVILSKCYLI